MYQISCNRILLIMDIKMVEGIMIDPIKVIISILLNNNNRSCTWQCNNKPTLDRETVISNVDFIIAICVN